MEQKKSMWKKSSHSNAATLKYTITYSPYTQVPEMWHDLINQNHRVYANMSMQRNEY